MVAPSQILQDFEHGLNSGATPGLRKIQSLVSAAGNLTINTRDGMGRVTSYVDAAGTTWTVTYGDDGPATISGGGQTRTFNYTAGLLTGYTAS